MSTSDPHRPGGATDGPQGTTPDETTPSIEETTPAGDDSPHHEVAPTVETLDPPTATEPVAADPVEPTTPVAEPAVAEPAATEPVATKPTAADPAAVEPITTEPVTTEQSGPSVDTGRHAVVRPAPTPPDEPAPDPVLSQPAAATPVAPVPVVEKPVVAQPVVAQPVAVTPVVEEPVTPEPTAAAGATAPPASEDDRLFPDPNAPRSTTVGSHILGVLVGLVLAPIGIAVLLLGQSRILQAQVDGWDASTEVLGIVLVSLGLLLLGCVLLMALWTPAVPITGGTVLTLAGIVYLYLPSVAREQTLTLLSSSGWRLTVTQVTVAGTSGTVLVAGFLLLLAGLVAAAARRRGVHLGEFRERHRV